MQAYVLNKLVAQPLLQQGRADEAIAALALALRNIEDRVRPVMALAGLGWLEASKGNIEGANVIFDAATDLVAALSDKKRQAKEMWQIGETQACFPQLADAAKISFATALELSRSIEDEKESLPALRGIIEAQLEETLTVGQNPSFLIIWIPSAAYEKSMREVWETMAQAVIQGKTGETEAARAAFTSVTKLAGEFESDWNTVMTLLETAILQAQVNDVDAAWETIDNVSRLAGKSDYDSIGDMVAVSRAWIYSVWLGPRLKLAESDPQAYQFALSANGWLQLHLEIKPANLNNRSFDYLSDQLMFPIAAKG